MKIKVEKMWNFWDVREMCVNHHWYTRGNNKEYNKMLDFVEKHKPTLNNMIKVAEDIIKHSADSDLQITEVLSCLDKFTVISVYSETE